MCRRIRRWWWIILAALGLNWPGGKPSPAAVPPQHTRGWVSLINCQPSLGDSQRANSNKKGDDDDGDSIGRQSK